MPSLHIFNADHDYALGSGSISYTPPRQVYDMMHRLAGLPTLWAEDADCIAAPDAKSLAAIDWLKIDSIKPWGWNLPLRRLLLRAGAPALLLPSEADIATLRDLSHRRTSILLNRHLQTSGINGIDSDSMPRELTDADECMKILADVPQSYFKAPWSSSGRGVLRCDGMALPDVRRWIEGIIRRQGSVMHETEATRRLDCASLWVCSEGEARYLGLSIFHTSFRGKYHGNICAPQSMLEERFAEVCDVPLHSILKAQKKALSEIIAPHYSGPAGIDMIVTDTRLLRPCIEINLRTTMGHVAMRYRHRLERDFGGEWHPDPYGMMIHPDKYGEEIS